MPRFRFDKLVRDKIVQLCEEDPLVTNVDYKVLNDIEYKKALRDKVFEEGDEIPVQEEADDEVLGEISDLQAVLDALRDAYGYSEDQVREEQNRKAAKKGAFKNKHYIEFVDCDESSPWTKSFRADPVKYPEVKSDDEVRQ